jgi:inorganic pyrophosphatase
VPVYPGVVIRSRPIGALLMEDEAGRDEKILAVPADKLHPFYSNISSYRQMPSILIEQITHFFAHYKDLEKGKDTRVIGWVEPEAAAQLIRDGMERLKLSQALAE